MNTQFPTPTFITSDPKFSDYRPAVDATGDQILFERTPFAEGKATGATLLYWAQNITQPLATITPFLQAGDQIPPIQTRPDWSWVPGRGVVFNGSGLPNTPIQVGMVNSTGGAYTVVPASADYLYPTWTSDGRALLVFNNSKTAVPNPCTSLISLEGDVQQANLNGTDATGTPMFAGFATPKPGDATCVVYAGQPANPGWGPKVPPPACPALPSGYNQCYNYVFLNSEKSQEFRSAPLESNANLQHYQLAHQGRAPRWSPNGRFVVFESNRLGGYALFLFDTHKGGPAVQLTDPAYDAQHAKFFASGDRIVATLLQQPDSSSPRGIACVDISPFI